ncbi:Alpha/beta hydrolase family protein [Desulfacinum hydrothermale DSM 13146]|uniref:Alpha/beta hydrolase family protein n=1 Tax=Desulfacinum hydrothermale DSM 13146 TaxID=1121390 RepID=A0A1W1XMV5_9BACT|nr:alpha/beta fold hydrolase [Desulfacinum hydrothermale]SMC25167.1 Alpha/beta hydrolase family protein [Desulfacinum hydrothermale DSM 13146]
MKTEPRTFQNRNGVPLSARMDLPSQGKPVAAVLFAHCFTCSKNLGIAVHLSKALTDAGYGVFRFDFTGLGESGGDFAGTGFISHVEDVLDAARFMEGEGHAPALLVGHSLGGAAVLQAARSVASCRAVAVIGAPYSPHHVTRLFAGAWKAIERNGVAEIDLGGRRIRIGRPFLERFNEEEMPTNLARLGRALLILHSPADQVVGMANAERIFKAARHPKSFISLDAADHLLSSKEDAQYAGRVIAAWAQRYVK